MRGCQCKLLTPLRGGPKADVDLWVLVVCVFLCRADSGQDYISGRLFYIHTEEKHASHPPFKLDNRCQLVFPPVFYLSHLTLPHLCPAFHRVPWGACRCKLPLKSWVWLCHSFLCLVNIPETDQMKNLSVWILLKISTCSEKTHWLSNNDLMLRLLVCDVKSFGHFILKACLSTVIQTYSLG